MTVSLVAPRPLTRVDVFGLGRAAVLLLAGAAPVSAIPLFVLGWVPLADSALFGVLPLAVVATALLVRRSPEAGWAWEGLIAGLVAVFAYDAVRMPLVWMNVWPDFIPRLGGWVTGQGGHDALVGYTWRWIGDGGGIGIAFFVFCGLLLRVRPSVVTARPVLLAVAYGVFIWGGLMATVLLPARGQQLLFHVTPASFALSLVGHLVYGTTLGLFLRRQVRARAALPAVAADAIGSKCAGPIALARADGQLRADRPTRPAVRCAARAGDRPRRTARPGP
jgi:hypothetical protein